MVRPILFTSLHFHVDAKNYVIDVYYDNGIETNDEGIHCEKMEKIKIIRKDDRCVLKRYEMKKPGQVLKKLPGLKFYVL